ncbi:MAG: mannonate dehydratase [Bryobacteraceae bacterium]|nr:mannonate dehydratase [Bryobacteraceae bacterium]
MQKITRRTGIKGAIGAMAATGLTEGAARRTAPSGKPGIKFALMNGSEPSHVTRVGKQIGVDYAISGVSGVLSRTERSNYEAALAKVKADFASSGVTVAGVESHPVPAEKIKLGIDGRDEEIENYISAIRALSNVGIPVLCYNFMAGLSWYRTTTTAKGRGGALVTVFDNKEAVKQGLTKWGEISEDKMWDNISYFLKAVIPEAQKANIKMALHPDDPPLSPLRGIGRIVTSAKNYRRIMDMAPSPVNGITFCQANFVAMGEDVEALAKEWLKQKKIFFVHFRDIRGNREYIEETFHDEGSTDMARMLEVYHQNGFDGPLRPDHAPTLDGAANDKPGYALEGKVFAIGYFKGIMQGKNLPYA